MAQNSVQTQAQEINQNQTDPKTCYQGMAKLVDETESELGRIHEELVVLVEGLRAMVWHEDEGFEFNPDAWHRLMDRTVAQVETLRSNVEDGAMKHRLRPTAEECAEEARKDKAMDALLNGARAIAGNKPQAAEAFEAADRLSVATA